MSTSGLRERKKQRTKEAIQREAMRLFHEQGYEDTTIEQIAAAAEISPSTFFNYFPAKEDLILYDRYDPIMFSMMMSRPSDEPISVVFQHAFEGMAGAFERDRDVILTRAKLGLEVPAVRARFWEELEKAQVLLGAVIAARSGRDPADFELRVLTMVLITAAFEASIEWVRRDGRGSMVDLVKQAFELSGVGPRLDALVSGSPPKARPL